MMRSMRMLGCRRTAKALALCVFFDFFPDSCSCPLMSEIGISSVPTPELDCLEWRPKKTWFACDFLDLSI